MRALRPEDQATVVSQHREAFEPEVAFHELVLQRLFSHERAVNLVAETETGVLGYCAALHGAREQARLWTLHVAPQARGQGIARALLEALDRRLEARGVRTLELYVHLGNEPAQRLYEACGYEVVQVDPHRYPNLEPSTGLVMRKRLPDHG